MFFFFFFFNDTATTEIYTLSLHDALPIYPAVAHEPVAHVEVAVVPDRRTVPRGSRERSRPLLMRSRVAQEPREPVDRKSTRLNSSHLVISYAVFCLKKKKKSTTILSHTTA